MTSSKTLTPLQLRIVLEAPTRDAPFALQHGKDTLVQHTLSTGADISFDFEIGYFVTDGEPDFRGPFVQGPRGGRFVYVNSGVLAGQAQSHWNRRAKIALSGITADLLAAVSALPDQRLCTRIAGKAKDGGPPAATVPLLGGWILAQA